MAPSRSTTTWRIAEFLSGRGLTRLPTWMPGWWETRVVIRIWSNNVPARFQEFQVTASTLATDQIVRRVSGREVELSKRRAENPKPKLWRRFETPSYGTGRSVRFGDLDGDGRVEMLLAQNIPRVRGDGFDQISCLTAVTLEGQVLWQSGRPDPRNGLLTNATRSGSGSTPRIVHSAASGSTRLFAVPAITNPTIAPVSQPRGGRPIRWRRRQSLQLLALSVS